MPTPRVRITTTNIGKSVFSVTFFCPTQQAIELEQKVTEEFLSFFYARKTALSQQEKGE